MSGGLFVTGLLRETGGSLSVEEILCMKIIWARSITSLSRSRRVRLYGPGLTGCSSWSTPV
jgi:hypothetical protein